MEHKKCPICDQEKFKISPVRNKLVYEIECQICGTYKISEEAYLDLESDPNLKNRKYILSGIIRNSEKSKIEIHTKNIINLIESTRIPKDPLEAIDRIILYIFKKSLNETHDSFVSITAIDYPIVYAKNQDEFFYYLKKAVDLNFIEKDNYDSSNEYRLTIPQGWLRVDELKKTTQLSNQAFIAMWFDPSLDEIWGKAFKPALKQTGFNPIRMDKTEHNERIDDKIIADIRKSALLVADLTEHRQGVYFEAGFALGLGIQVIWTCRDDQKDKIHFDTRQYNCIFWKSPEELKERLINRIEANPIYRD